MKQVYAVLVLALVLVFALGGVASAGTILGEDYDRPTGDPSDDGLNEDHPWGGDCLIGDGGSDDRTDDRQVVSIATTDYLYVDLWLIQLYRMFISDDPVVTTTQEYETRPEYERSYRVSRPVSLVESGSPISDGKVVAR